jgi:hypothetical protein
MNIQKSFIKTKKQHGDFSADLKIKTLNLELIYFNGR